MRAWFGRYTFICTVRVDSELEGLGHNDLGGTYETLPSAQTDLKGRRGGADRASTDRIRLFKN